MPAVLLFPLPGLLEEIARQRGRVDVAAWRQLDREGEIWTGISDMDRLPPRGGVHRAARPVGQLVKTSRTSTAVILATLGSVPSIVPGIGHTPAVAFRDPPAGSPLPRHRLPPAGLAITSGATRAARCARESAARGSLS